MIPEGAIPVVTFDGICYICQEKTQVVWLTHKYQAVTVCIKDMLLMLQACPSHTGVLVEYRPLSNRQIGEQN